MYGEEKRTSIRVGLDTHLNGLLLVQRDLPRVTCRTQRDSWREG
jgi:hypothetical protein